MEKYLVIRCNNLDGVNPIEQVNSVIAEKGYCWFGKYGQPIGRLIRMPSVFGLKVILATNKPKHWATYALRKASFLPPTDGNYPAYYAKNLYKISTWLQLEITSEPEINQNRLVVQSSLKPVEKALNDSMRGHFWCKRIHHSS